MGHPSQAPTEEKEAGGVTEEEKAKEEVVIQTQKSPEVSGQPEKESV